jgi:hypothetical protein
MYGRNLLAGSTVNMTRVSADNAPQYKAGGATIDWTTVTATGSDTTLTDGSVIKTGIKYLRYGQVLCKITGAANTVTIGGTPTGGTFTLTVTTSSPVAGAPSQTTSALAYNAAASVVQTALQALSNVGTGNATVTGSAGGPYTIVFGSALGTVTVGGSIASLTGGTPTFAAGASIASGTTVGYFGPYDPGASDGRQTLTRGECFILDETLLQYGIAGSGLAGANDQTGGLIEGGLLWLDRILHSGTATHTLALGPTKAEVLTAFPSIRVVEN